MIYADDLGAYIRSRDVANQHFRIIQELRGIF